MRKGKMIVLLCALALFFALPGCNEGDDGYIAPTGSTLSMPSNVNYKVLTELHILMTVKVSLPDGEPANGVQIMLVCNYCDMLDAGDGGDLLEAMTNDNLVEVGNPFLTRTDIHGQRKMVVRITAPANYDVTSYEADFWADIVVANGETTITVEEF